MSIPTHVGGMAIDAASAPDLTPRKGGIILPFDGIWPAIHPEAFVAETAVVIGKVIIGAGSSIWYGAVLRGDVNRIMIGNDSNIQDGTIVHVNRPRPVTTAQPTDPPANPKGDSSIAKATKELTAGLETVIGNDVTIGHMALIHACHLENRAFVGMRAVVMDGATVAGDAMVAAGAMVTPRKHVPSGELWAGSPAKKMRDLTPDEIAGFAPQAAHYARLGARYREARCHRSL